MYIHQENMLFGATHVYTSREYVYWGQPCIYNKRIRLLGPIMYINQENTFIGVDHVYTSREYVYWGEPCTYIKRIRLLRPTMYYIHQGLFSESMQQSKVN